LSMIRREGMEFLWRRCWNIKTKLGCIRIVEFGIRELIRHPMTKNMTDMKYTTSSVDAKTIKSLNTIQVK
jgi:hypothetical protein